MTKDEALTLALEALEQIDPYVDQLIDYSSTAAEYPLNNAPRNVVKAITAIKKALAQPEQEPDDAIELFEYWNAVEGWVKIDEVRKHFDSVGCGTIYKTAGEDRVPLYTSPPQRPWVGLTATEIHDTDGYTETREMYRFACALEAKLKEKNT